jgi:hypothetical protein
MAGVCLAGLLGRTMYFSTPPLPLCRLANLYLMNYIHLITGSKILITKGLPRKILQNKDLAGSFQLSASSVERHELRVSTNRG